MSKLDLLQEIIKTYQKYGWKLYSLLLTEDLKHEVKQLQLSNGFLHNALIKNSVINAIWFTRPSGNRNAGNYVLSVHRLMLCLKQLLQIVQFPNVNEFARQWKNG
jgi:hypothetical protein